MNWTGGRLQRHSKANANATLKAQKQHFAKARLQQQNGRPVPSPLHFSTFKVPPKPIDKVDQDQNRGVKRRKISEVLASDSPSTKHRRFHHHQTDIRLNHPVGSLEPQDHIHQHNITAESKVQPDPDKETRKPAQAERNTLDAVKRSLLRRSDWMGLNAARPLHVEFPSARELENIGRRRRVTVEDRKRKEGGQKRYNGGPATDSVFPLRRAQHEPEEMQIEGASIRIGSNIHQSQTTPMPSRSNKPSSVMCQSESSESMLLDKEVPTCHKSIDSGSSSKTFLTLSIDSAEQPRRTSLERSFVSLDQVRDSETFDEVKAKSDSISKQSLANQQGLSKTLRRRVAKRSLASEGAKSSSIVVGRRLLHSTPSRSEGSNLHTLSKAKRSRPVTGEKLSLPIPESLSSDFLPPSRAPVYNHGGRPSSSSFDNQGVASEPPLAATKPQAGHPAAGQNQLRDRSKFTLELQVQAEAQAAGTVDASMHDKNHAGDIPGEYQEMLSFQRIRPNLASDDTDKAFGPACAVWEEQEPKLTESSPALTGTRHHDTSGQNIARRHPQVGQTLWSPEKRNGPEAVHGSIARSPDVAQAKRPLKNRIQSRKKNPMRQTLGEFQQPDPEEQDPRHIAAAESNQNQAWMRFILQDEMSEISSNFYEDPHIEAHSVHSTPKGWLRHRPSDDDTLSRNRELLSTQLQSRSSLSPVQTIKTATNTTIHVADPDAGSTSSGKTAPSETDFLSQLSPMEGKLHERLFNPSVYTNPARTERSYIAAPSQTAQRYENGVQSDSRGQFSMHARGLSPVHSTYGYSHVQVLPIHSSPAPTSRWVTTTSHPSTTTKPLQPISNLFTEPGRSSLHLLQRSSDLYKKSFQSSSMILRASGQGISEGQWIDPPRSVEQSSLSARRQVNTFPMDYTPIKHAIKKHRQGYPAPNRPSSSYSIVAQLDHHHSEIDQAPHHMSHSKISCNLPSSPYIPDSHPGASNSADEFTNAYPAPNSKQQYHQPYVSAASPIIHPSRENLDTPPPQPPVSSPDHFVFTKPPPFLGDQPVSRATAAPSSAHTPMRRPVTLRQVEAFNTPQRMRQPFAPRQTTPFSTPRPRVRSVLGAFKRPEPLPIGLMDLVR